MKTSKFVLCTCVGDYEGEVEIGAQWRT